jgi:chemotaxis protein histidine kinase CheA
MDKLTKIFFTFLIIIPLVLGYPGTTLAESDKKQTKIQIILELKKEITELGSKPVKRGIRANNKFIAILEEQLEELKEEKKKLKEKKKKEDDLKLARDKRKKELEAEIKDKYGETPITESQKEVDEDEEIKALIKQKEELEKKEAEEKKKAEAVKKAKEEKEKAEKAKEEKEQKRAETIARVKKEIYFLGGTPILEFEIESDDQYIEALRKQIEDLEIKKAAEEKEIRESIPEWFVKMPQSSDLTIYVRGTDISDDLQLSIDLATNAALRSLGKKLETRLNSKAKETVKQAGIGSNKASKSEFNRISSIVVKEVTISGWEIHETKMVKQENGDYRSFVLLKYPIGKALKAYKNEIDKSPELKGRLTLIKNTDAYKELEKAVAQYSGS